MATVYSLSLIFIIKCRYTKDFDERNPGSTFSTHVHAADHIRASVHIWVIYHQGGIR